MKMEDMLANKRSKQARELLLRLFVLVEEVDRLKQPDFDIPKQDADTCMRILNIQIDKIKKQLKATP